MHAMRYVSLNPVRVKLVERAKDWSGSSIIAHLNSKDDGFVKVSPAWIATEIFQRFLDKKRVGLTNASDSQRLLVAHWEVKHG